MDKNDWNFPGSIWFIDINLRFDFHKIRDQQPLIFNRLQTALAELNQRRGCKISCQWHFHEGTSFDTHLIQRIMQFQLGRDRLPVEIRVV